MDPKERSRRRTREDIEKESRREEAVSLLEYIDKHYEVDEGLIDDLLQLLERDMHQQDYTLEDSLNYLLEIGEEQGPEWDKLLGLITVSLYELGGDLMSSLEVKTNPDDMEEELKELELVMGELSNNRRLVKGDVNDFYTIVANSIRGPDYSLSQAIQDANDQIADKRIGNTAMRILLERRRQRVDEVLKLLDRFFSQGRRKQSNNFLREQLHNYGELSPEKQVRLLILKNERDELLLQQLRKALELLTSELSK